MPFSDIVVLLPGIMGSVLRKGGKDGRDVWSLGAGTLFKAVWTLGRSLEEIALPHDDPERDSVDDIAATRLLPDTTLLPGFWRIDGYTRIADTLRSRLGLKDAQTFFEFPYDWRRDNRVAARRLAQRVPGWLEAHRKNTNNPDAKVWFLGHSMGGLVARYYLEVLGGHEYARGLITFGTPFRGSVAATDVLVNGFRKGIGSFTVADLTTLVRSFTSVHQLLPTFTSVDDGAGTLRHLVDLPAVANLDMARVRAARELHATMDAAAKLERPNEYQIYPFVGIGQPTLSSAVLDAHGVKVSRSIQGKEHGGDGTVPRISAVPDEERHSGRERYASERHASLQNSHDVLHQVLGILTAEELGIDALRSIDPRLDVRRGTTPIQRVGLALDVEDVVEVGAPIEIRCARNAFGIALDTSGPTIERDPRQEHLALVAYIGLTDAPAPTPLDLVAGDDGTYRATFVPREAGAYRVTVGGGPRVIPVSDVFAAYDRAPLTARAPSSTPPPATTTVEPVMRKPIADPLLPTELPSGFEKMRGAERVERVPTARLEGALCPDATVAFLVNLETPGVNETRDILAFLAATGRDEIPVTVLIAPSRELLVDPDDETQLLLLRRSGASEPCRFEARVAADAKPGDTATVTFSFLVDSGYIGALQTTFAIEAITATPAERTAEPVAARGVCQLTEIVRERPLLTVQILRSSPKQPGELTWMVTPSQSVEGLPGRLVGPCSITDPIEYARSFAAEAKNAGVGHEALFRGFGSQLWDAAPLCFRQTYLAFRAVFGRDFDIQLLSDDPYIPWELMVPRGETLGADVGALLVDHAVARWLLDYQTQMTPTIPRGQVLTIAPTYLHSTTLPPLPAAQAESKLLRDAFGATAVTPMAHDVLAALTRPQAPVGFVHFAGHGELAGAAAGSRIYLEDDSLTSVALRGVIAPPATGARPLVFFNACETGASTDALVTVGGWAEAFVTRKYAGIIAPLWPVYDTHAQQFLAALAEGVLRAGRPVAEVLRDIRRAHAAQSPTYLAYVFVGDVRARMRSPE